MKSTRRRIAVAIAGIGAVTALSINSAVAVDDSKEVRQSDFISALSDTRSNGSASTSYEEGLVVQTKAQHRPRRAPRTTTRPPSTSPSRGPPVALPSSGSDDWSGTPVSRTPRCQPGAQIVFDTRWRRGQRGSYNVLVGEQVYSDNEPGEPLTNRWYTGGSRHGDDQRHTCPSAAGGSGSGTVTARSPDWQDAVPRRSRSPPMGSASAPGSKGDGILRAQ